MSTDSNILLKGLDGSNPLAFLAALGTFRTLSIAIPDETPRMNWERHEGAWRPRIWCSLASDVDELLDVLDKSLAAAATRSCFAIGDNLNLPASTFRAHLLECANDPKLLASPEGRVNADFLVAFGSDAITNDDGTMQDTALRTMSGAGHQHFLKFFRELVNQTDVGHLRRTLLMKWDYADEGRGMNLRWDPQDDRRYALRWKDPSSDPNKTMRGANRLAMEALPLLPTMPVAGRLATTAFRGQGARGTQFVWPIWKPLVSASILQSLLTSVFPLREEMDITACGISALFSSARITIGKFRNFTPATPEPLTPPRSTPSQPLAPLPLPN